MSSWKECKLGEVAEINMGQSPKSEFYNQDKIGLPFLQGNRTFGLKYPYFDTYCSEPTKIAKHGEILFSVRAPVGDINIANDEICIGRGLCSINSKDKNNEFLYYLLHFLKNEIINNESGSVFGSINRTDLSNINVLYPPIEEQKAIAEVLSSLDDKIDLLHRQNQTLESLAQTLFRQWFIEVERDEWEIGKLGEAIEIFDNKRIPLSKTQRDKMKNNRLYPYYGASKIIDYVNDFIFDGEYILMGEDGTVRTDEGYPVLQYATGKFWTNNHTHVIQAKEPYSNFFIWNYLSNKNIDEIVTGAVQPKINQGNLQSLDFPKYPLHLIQAFNEQSKDFFKKINQNKKQIQTLENLRDTLLPKLLSGEIKMKL